MPKGERAEVLKASNADVKFLMDHQEELGNAVLRWRSVPKAWREVWLEKVRTFIGNGPEGCSHSAAALYNLISVCSKEAK